MNDAPIKNPKKASNYQISPKSGENFSELTLSKRQKDPKLISTPSEDSEFYRVDIIMPLRFLTPLFFIQIITYIL